MIKDEKIKKLDEKYKKLDEKMKTIDNLILKMKNNIVEQKANNTLSYGEKFIAINFLSLDQRINHSIICKNNTNFHEIEKELYLKYPEYSKNYNYLTCNGLIVNKRKTLEDNGINGYTIIVNKIDGE